MLDRRTFLRGAAATGVALAAPAMTSCGGDDDALTFFFQAKPDEAKVRKQIIDEFAERHPDIKIRTVLAGADPNQQLLTYCAGGKCPDIMMAWELTYSRLAELGVLLDLNTMLRKDPAYAAQLKADSTPVLYDTFTFKGGQFALPEQWSGVFLYYNRKLFEQAGIGGVPGRWDDAWSFDEFLDVAKQLTRRDSDGTVEQWGFADPWVPHYTASIFGMNNGADWFTPLVDPTRTNIDDDAFMEGFQFYADLATRHKVALRPVLSSAGTSVDGADMFSQGKVGMAVFGHWMYTTFSGMSDLEFDVTPLPAGPRGHGARSDVGTTGIAIAADSPRKERAWEFVKFATGPVGQEIVAKSGLFVPALKSAIQSPEFASAHTKLHNLDVLTGGPDNSNHLPVTPQWPRIDSTFTRACDRVLRGDATADWFTKGTAHQIDDILRMKT